MTDGHIEWKMQSNPHELENLLRSITIWQWILYGSRTDTIKYWAATIT